MFILLCLRHNKAYDLPIIGEVNECCLVKTLSAASDRSLKRKYNFSAHGPANARGTPGFWLHATFLLPEHPGHPLSPLTVLGEEEGLRQWWL